MYLWDFCESLHEVQRDDLCFHQRLVWSGCMKPCKCLHQPVYFHRSACECPLRLSTCIPAEYWWMTFLPAFAFLLIWRACVLRVRETVWASIVYLNSLLCSWNDPQIPAAGRALLVSLPSNRGACGLSRALEFCLEVERQRRGNCWRLELSFSQKIGIISLFHQKWCWCWCSAGESDNVYQKRPTFPLA